MHPILTFTRPLLLIGAIMAVNSAHGQAVAVGRYAKVNGIRMYHEIHGAGEPLVLVHGGGSTIETSFGRLLPFLVRTRKVIAVEMQAHGRTSDRPGPESFEQDADDVAELLKQLSIPRADILGFSNGGSTALQVALRHPDRVRGLIVVSGMYKRDGLPPGFWNSMHAATFKDMPQVYKDAFLRVNPDPDKLLLMFEKDRQRMVKFTDWTADDMRSIVAPALIVVGDKDIIRPEHALELSKLLPHGRLAILPGGHGDFMGEAMVPHSDSRVPELFVALCDEFLSTAAR
ncbi:MAG: alpha/beta hydrolase [Gemmatimonadaceae bacterium]